MSEWKAISRFRRQDRTKVDIWLTVPASPMSMGMSDAWRVTDAWRVDGKWFHDYNGKPTEIVSDYVTHWKPLPEPPQR